MLCECLRSAISKDAEELNMGSVTVSIGAAIFPAHAHDQEGLIEITDKALYQAKVNGKDRIQFAELQSESWVSNEQARH